MARLILIRHGESEGNRDRVFTPTPDVPLTERGRAQALSAGRWIARRHRPIRIVSSPFARARGTAEVLAGVLGLPIALEADLRERSYGALAGQPYGTLRGESDFDRSVYWEWRPPNGETLVEVAARTGAVVDRIAIRHPEDEIVVVSHGAVMMALWWHMTGAWKEHGVVPNAGIVLAEHRGGAYHDVRFAEES